MAAIKSIPNWHRGLLVAIFALNLIGPSLGDESDDQNLFQEYFHMLAGHDRDYPYNYNNFPLNRNRPEKRVPGSEFLGKRVPGSEFLGKRVPGSEFLGKRVPGSEFLGKRVPGSEFLGKRVPGSEFLGKRVPGSEFLGKRIPGSEFLGKRGIHMLDDEDFDYHVKRAPEYSEGIPQSDRDIYFKSLRNSFRR